MVQGGDTFGFTLETRHKTGIAGQVGVHDLNRHVTIEVILVGLIDLSHTTACQSLYNAVFPEGFTDQLLHQHL